MSIVRIGLDTAKHVFQVHGVEEAERAVLRRQLRRGEVDKFFAKLPPTRIGLEACGAARHWARLLQGLGHEVWCCCRRNTSSPEPAPAKAFAGVKRRKNERSTPRRSARR